MSVYTYAFSGGVDSVPGYGQKETIQFGGDWVFGETWSLAFATTLGNMTLGKGYWTGTPTYCFTFKNRVYVGMGDRWLFSANNDPTAALPGPMQWEEQNDGAGYLLYNSYIGGQDEVIGFGQLQGRLAVFGKKSIQIWVVDADPANFSNAQSLEHIGTQWPLAIASMGDYDCMFFATSGIRSLRTKEITLNASPEDLGSPVDIPITNELNFPDWISCATVEPVDNNYWVFANDKLYVFTNRPSSKIMAWSNYMLLDDAGEAFTPQKFVILNERVYCRGIEGKLLVYGGVDGGLYDGSIVFGQTPWLENRKPSTLKHSMSVDAIFSGQWTVKGSLDHRQTVLKTILQRGDNDGPDVTIDTSLGTGKAPFMTMGTHFCFQFYSSGDCRKKQLFSAIILKDQQGNLV
jgi:hypothetical protein